MHKTAFGGVSDLPRKGQPCGSSVFRRLVKICIFKNDEDVGTA